MAKKLSPKIEEVLYYPDNWVRIHQALPHRLVGGDGLSKTVLISDGENVGLGNLDYTNLDADDMCSPEGEILMLSCWTDFSVQLNKTKSGYPKVSHWMYYPYPPKG